MHEFMRLLQAYIGDREERANWRSLGRIEGFPRPANEGDESTQLR